MLLLVSEMARNSFGKQCSTNVEFTVIDVRYLLNTQESETNCWVINVRNLGWEGETFSL